MAETTAIEWCNHTFNPWLGCAKVSPGCVHCYAESISRRNPRVLGVWGPSGTRVIASESYWRKPPAWDRKAARAGERRKVFCGSMCDVFEDHPDVVDARRRLFDLIPETPHLDWLLLTKRPENVVPMVERLDQFPNVWLGASVEDQKRAEERIPELLRVPAVIHFLSCEPLLGPVSLLCDGDGRGRYWLMSATDSPCAPAVDWVIVGGESGSRARPMMLEWARWLVVQCRRAGVPAFVKQLGAAHHCIHSDKGGCLDCMPPDLRVREFPTQHD
jgi:protein gp37